MIVIFIGFMLITWFLSVQLTNKVNQQWGAKFAERQVMFDKSRTLAPLIREIALARQMAAEPAIIAMALREHDPEFRRRGIAVMEKYRSNFRDHSYFAAFAQSGNYYFNDAANQYAGKQLRYVLSPTVAKDKWFYATLTDVKEYEVSLDFNAHLKVTKAWINVLIRSGNETLGIIGTGIDLSDLIKETVNITQPGVANLFIDQNMAIQLHSDPKLIDYMTVAKDAEQRIKVDVLLKNPADIDHLRQVMLELERSPADIATLWVTYEGKRHLLGVAYLPEIGWYGLTLMDEHNLNFFDGMFIGPLLFGLILLLALLTVGWALRSWILNPIAALRTSTDKIGHGDFEIEPAIQGAGEIAHLSQAFTRMAEVVRNSNLELEEKVRERTTTLIEEITERKKSEESLGESRSLLRATLEATADGILVVDATGRISGSNERFITMWGLPTDILVQGNDKRAIQFVLDQLKNPEGFLAKVIDLYSHPEDNSFDLLEFKDGKFFERHSLPQRIDGKPVGRVWSFSDITERKRAQDEILRLNASLEEQVQQRTEELQETYNQLLQSEKMASIGQLAAGVAHEINNPIGFVYSNLSTLGKYVQNLSSMVGAYEQAEGAIADGEIRAQLAAARKKLDITFIKEDMRSLMKDSKAGITRVKNIVQNLTDFSHMDASDEWHYADLHAGLNSTLNIVNYAIKHKTKVIKQYGTLPQVECLPSQLNQVFMNLLINAVHATEERGTITLRSGTEGDEVWVEITDIGKGIAPEHLQKIFDPFFTTKPIGKGTGLGLSISYGIIQKHHGRIEVSSEVGNGTTFRIWLPVKHW